MDFSVTEEEIETFKGHIQFEGGMDATMLPFYLKMAKKYVYRATGKEESELIYFTAAMFNDFRVPEEEMQKAFEAMTPLFIQESCGD